MFEPQQEETINIFRNIINKWDFQEGRAKGLTQDEFESLMKSETNNYAELHGTLISYCLIKSDIYGRIYPTEKLLIYREKEDIVPDCSKSEQEAIESKWIDFRNLLTYYIRCIIEADRPQFFLNISKEGRDYVILRKLDPRWLQGSNESPLLVHKISFTAGETPIMAKILNDSSIDSRVYLGYPVMALYDSGVLSRLVPLAMVPVNYEPISNVNSRKLEITVTLDFKHAMLNQEWVDSSIPADMQPDFNKVVYETSQGNDNELFDLAQALPFLKDFTNNMHLDPETPLQAIPTVNSNRSMVCNTVILFNGRSTNYVRSLLRELEYIKNAPCNYLEKTSLAYVFRNPPLPINSNSKKTAVPFTDSNDEQLDAVCNAISFPISRLQGPPGTGKTQVALNMIANCIYNGESVLFTSKNHQAVDAIKDKNSDLLDDSFSPVFFCIEDKARSSWFDVDLTSVRHELEAMTPPNSPELNLVMESSLHKAADLENLIRQKNILVKSISLSSLKLAKEVKKLSNLLVGTRFRENQELLTPDLLKSAIQSCDISISASIFGKIRKTFSRNRIEKALTSIAEGSPKIIEMLERSGFRELKSLLTDIEFQIKCIQPYKEKYERENRELQELPLTNEEVNELSQLISAMRSVSKESLAFRWLNSIDAVSDYQLENLDSVKNRFKSDYLRILKNKSEESMLPQYYQALDTLHHIQPAWATSLLSMHLAAPIIPAVFDQVIIDEASQCDCISIIPAMYRSKRIAVIGDPEQFKPIFNLTPRRNKKLKEIFLKNSSLHHLDYLANSAYSILPGDTPFVMLKEHFRCVPGIADYFSKNFYSNNLVIRTDAAKQVIPSCYPEEESIHWVDTKGSLEDQIEATVNELQKIKQSDYTGSIGVICPLGMVVSKIRGLLQDIPGCADILVNTAYGFQGGQMDTILFILANSSKDIKRGQYWYISDPINNNIYNVSVSRAKACLVIIGNRSVCRESRNTILRSLAMYPLPVEETEYRFDSKLEEMLFFALKEAGIHTRIQWPVGPYRLDLAYMEQELKLDIEVDGYQYHFDSAGNRKQHDARRDDYMVSAGWKVIRFLGTEVMNNLGHCVETVKQVIEFKER